MAVATYQTGTVTLTNGDQTVVGAGTAFVGSVNVGGIFVGPDNVPYVIGYVTDDTHVELSAPFVGVSGAGLSYQITNDFAGNLPLVREGDRRAWGIFSEAMRRINAMFTALVDLYQPVDALLSSLSALTVAAGDLIIGTGAHAVSKLAIGAEGLAFSVSGGVLAWVNPPVSMPQGRLTLTGGAPVLQTDVAGATTIYYTPYIGDRVPIYDGTRFIMKAFAELSQPLSDTTKSPAASAADKNYDLFVWDDAGILRLSRGPFWSSNTARGTGAGTTELQRVQGFLTNTVAIANGPAAGHGTYVGTIRTNGSNQVPMLFKPTPAVGGTANKLYCWNAYNRRLVSAVCRESTDSWTYTLATLRAMNGNVNNSIAYVAGLAEGGFSARARVSSASGTGQQRFFCIGYDSIVTPMADGCLNDFTNLSGIVGQTALLDRSVELGLHTITALEYAVASGTTTWYGDSGGPSLIQSGVALSLEM